MYIITKGNYGIGTEFVGLYSSKVKAIKALREIIIKKPLTIFSIDLICNKSTKWKEKENYNSCYTGNMTRTQIYTYLYNSCKSGIVDFGTHYTIQEVTPNTVKVD